MFLNQISSSKIKLLLYLPSDIVFDGKHSTSIASPQNVRLKLHLTNHFSISHILGPCQGRKWTRFNLAPFSDWSVIGALNLPAAAPNALRVFSRRDPISPYLAPLRSELTNNTRISYSFHHHSSTLIA